ncbi:MAG: NAD(P)-dependent oxidoreductase [Proteobacteria bacterium]|nr:NAD(P)-dependent oxidoreductase [Pseudomonadota bacterium]MBU1686277.1 NAD(P)-dependent oxidoreductase [Pseudomonadota bacterium]
MDVKERMAISRQKPRELVPAERIKHFDEVTAGYDHQNAILEAERCLQCKKPKCREGCPIHNDIPRFIRLLREGKIEEAYWADRETNSMPAICSRVCPHEFQCEGACVRGKKGEPVAIGMLERYLVDWMVANGKNLAKSCALPRDRKVAIIGSGPAGMTVAYHLAHAGFPCTIFESLPVLGGMLSVGIPSYRLPRSIIAAEFESLKNCGVKIVTDTVIGRDKSLQQLKDDGFEAVFIAVGAHASRKLGIEGEELDGVYHGVDYLRKINLGEDMNLGQNVVVVGGGNVAIDCARTALRTGSDKVFILYRRTKAEMPASQAEIHHLEEEGVKIEMLAAPVKIHGENGRLNKIECIRMQLGECDTSGRCRPVKIEGSNFMIDADAIVPAISQDVDLEAINGVELERTRWNTLVVDDLTMQASADWIFSGGDTVLGPQTVAKAVFQAKEAAESMIRFLEGRDLKEGRAVAESA